MLRTAMRGTTRRPFAAASAIGALACIAAFLGDFWIGLALSGVLVCAVSVVGSAHVRRTRPRYSSWRVAWPLVILFGAALPAPLAANLLIEVLPGRQGLGIIAMWDRHWGVWGLSGIFLWFLGSFAHFAAFGPILGALGRPRERRRVAWTALAAAPSTTAVTLATPLTVSMGSEFWLLGPWVGTLVLMTATWYRLMRPAHPVSSRALPAFEAPVEKADPTWRPFVRR